LGRDVRSQPPGVLLRGAGGDPPSARVARPHREHGRRGGVRAVAAVRAALREQGGRGYADERPGPRARARDHRQRGGAGRRAAPRGLGRRHPRALRANHAAQAARQPRGRRARRALSARGRRLRHGHDAGRGRRAVDPVSDVVVMRDVVVVGGGCYGTFYAGQLAKAQDKGKARFRRVIVVDRDPACRARAELGEAPDRTFAVAPWDGYFATFLGAAARARPGEPQDYIVPSPLMPHLMFQWVLARARQRWPERAVAVAPVPGSLGTPYDRTAPDRARYVSFADWICPTHCVEPATCPAIGGPRTWEMGDAVRAL